MTNELKALKRMAEYRFEERGIVRDDGTSFDEDFEIIENGLKRLEEIDNTKPSEALESLDTLDDMFYLIKYRTTENGNHEEYEFYPCETKEYNTIKQALLKAQEQEKENELLKEIIKSFFDRGCPLHQYTDKDGILTIEVDDECSIMHLGEFKGVDLDKKLKEVLE